VCRAGAVGVHTIVVCGVCVVCDDEGEGGLVPRATSGCGALSVVRSTYLALSIVGAVPPLTCLLLLPCCVLHGIWRHNSPTSSHNYYTGTWYWVVLANANEPLNRSNNERARTDSDCDSDSDSDGADL